MALKCKNFGHFRSNILFTFLTIVWISIGVGLGLHFAFKCTNNLPNKEIAFVIVYIAIGLILSVLSFAWSRFYGGFLDRLTSYVTQIESEVSDKIPPSSFEDKNDIKKLFHRIVTLFMAMQQTAEEIERDKQAALHEVQDKIKMKRELTNNINHELKTPVASISGYVEILLNNPDLEPEQRKDFLSKCFSQTQRLSSLLRDVSTISRLEETGLDSTVFERIDIHKLVNGIYADIVIQHKRPFKLNLNFNNSVFINGDPSLVQSIFQNLMNNAVAYSGGTDLFVRIISENKQFYTFMFADNGVGVDAVHLPHLFERFYRADKGRSRKLGGTGLGLAIVKNAVIHHGGKIKVNNGAYGGLQFVFSLPKYS